MAAAVSGDPPSVVPGASGHFYVLVVDDTDALRHAIVELLREEGIAATGFADGAEALEHLRRAATLPSLVVTDLMMPTLDGWALIRAIESEPTLAGLRVVAMTASPFCSAPRGIPLLRKPFRVEQLLAFCAPAGGARSR